MNSSTGFAVILYERAGNSERGDWFGCLSGLNKAGLRWISAG